MGNVHSQDSTVAGENFAAKYNGKEMVFNTLKVTLNPKDYNAEELKVEGWDSFKSKTTISLIKGVGTIIKYRIGQRNYDQMFLVVPY